MKTLAVLMAGGAGTRLTVLSDKRAKPAVPFAGKYRIIDFTLSNCINSDIYDIAVLTQYRPHSLNTHIGIGKPWDLDRQRGGVHMRQPYQGGGSGGDFDWYRGTADAVFRNIDFIEEKNPDVVLILSGDHIYKMDYRLMVDYHHQRGADMTVAVMEVPLEETDRFGIMTVNRNMRVTEFHEKPKARDKGNLASMGIYVFTTDILLERLSEGTADAPRIDFGKDVIPNMITRDKVYAYPFEGYWVDVGTVQSFWETNLALTDPTKDSLNLHDHSWVIRTRSEERPPAKLGPQAHVVNSFVSNGCVIRGRVEKSVLSPGVYVSPGAVINESIIINDTWIGPGVVLDRVIVDENAVIGAGTKLGFGDDMSPNKALPDKLNTGITVVGAGAQIPGGLTIGRNVLIGSNKTEADFPGTDIASGETV